MAEKPTYEELEQRVQELEEANSKFKLSKETLHVIQKQQEFLTEQTLLSIVIIQEDKIVYANKAYSELTGYPIEQILKWSIEDTIKLIHPDYREFVISQARKKMSGENAGIITSYQYKAISRKREERWIDQYSKTIFYNGKPSDMISMIDITESKQATKLLQESEEKYRLLAENVDDVIWRSDLVFNWIYISPSFIKLTGYSSEEAVKMPLQEMITPDSAETAATILMEELGKLKGPQTNDIVKKIEVEFYCKDGSTVWAEINTKIQMDSDGHPATLLGITRDISDRKRAEALILESEEKYRSIFENAIEGFFQSTPEGRFINVNPGFARMHGYATPEELTAAISDISTQYYVNPEDREGYQERLRENGYVENFEFKARCKDGSHIWVTAQSQAIYDQNGTLVRYEGNVHDITERKQAESEVMREKRFSEMVINQLPGSFYMFNEEGRILRWNDNLETVTGYSGAEIREMNALDFFIDDEKEEVYRKIQEVFLKGTSQVEANFLTKDGHKIPHYLTGTRVEYGGGNYLLGIGLDMTERREIEIALKESKES